MRSRSHRLAALASIAALGLSGAAAAAAGTVVKHHVTTVTLRPGVTATFDVAYPDALKYGGATYSGTVRVLPPAPGAAGGTPSLGRVTVLSRGQALGGSELAVRVRNANPRGTAAVRVRITATTREPAR